MRGIKSGGSAGLMGVLMLSACGSQTPSDESTTVPIDARQLCINAACGSRQSILDLPQLENQRYTRAGRLFVTGQQNWYEVERAAGGAYTARALLEAEGGCSGMAERGDYLYALCPGGLYGLWLTDPGATPQFIGALQGMTLPNGMALGPDDRLYVSDGPVALTPKIVRLQLDPADPLRLLGQETWLSTFPEFPNGVAIAGHALYTTLYVPPLGTVARIDIQADGTPGPVQRLYALGIADDLAVVGDTLLVTDWQRGAIVQLDLDGQPLQHTPLLSFLQPSSVDVAGPPLFERPTVLVTERYLGRGLWAWQPHVP